MQTHRPSRRPLRLTVSLALALLLIAAMLVPASAQQESPNDTYTLTVLHTNDTHANIKPCMATCNNANLGGVARRATAIQQVRAEGGNVLLADSGDYFQGTLFFNYYQGQEAAHFMEELGYQVSGIGNHEFDSGPPALARFIEAVDFPVTSANIDASAQISLTGLIEPYTVIEIGGESIGVFGLTTEETSNISSPGPDVIFNDHVATAQATIAVLEGMGLDKIVVLSHLGYDAEMALGAGVSGIDLIVGGHSHSPLGPMPGAIGPYPTEVTSPTGDPTLIVSSWEWGKYLGRIDLTFDENGVIQSYNGAPISIDASVPEDPVVAADVAVWEAPILAMQNTVIGSTDVLLDGTRQLVRTQETNLGNLICDAMLWKTEGVGSQICITNGGGIRASIQNGDITLGNVLTVLPFGNTVATLGLVGSDVLVALENGVSQWQLAAPAGRFAQVGGLRYSFDPDRPVGHRIMSAELQNPDGSFSPIEPNTVYQIVTNDFMRRGGDGYSVFWENAIDPYDTWAVMADSVVEYIQASEDDGGLGMHVTEDEYPLSGEGRITRVSPTVNRSRRFDASMDTFINGAQPNVNFGNNVTMWVGFDNQMRPAVYTPIPVCETGGSCIPAYAAVDAAYLYLYIVEGRGFTNWNQSVVEMDANPITAMWDAATATWNSPWSVPGGDLGPAEAPITIGNARVGTWARFDVTNGVQDIINGGDNNGFMVTSNWDVMTEAPEGRVDARYGFATTEHWDLSKHPYMRVMFRTYN